jgi:hypothetical protein
MATAELRILETISRWRIKYIRKLKAGGIKYNEFNEFSKYKSYKLKTTECRFVVTVPRKIKMKDCTKHTQM